MTQLPLLTQCLKISHRSSLLAYFVATRSLFKFQVSFWTPELPCGPHRGPKTLRFGLIRPCVSISAYLRFIAFSVCYFVLFCLFLVCDHLCMLILSVACFFNITISPKKPISPLFDQRGCTQLIFKLL